MSNNLSQATVFYSWESDLHAKTTRNLIEGCLNRAIQQLGRDDEIDVVPSLDRDTRGVSGSPVILDAILQKIDACTAFVADVSIINSGDASRPTPNPNVAIELGFAVKACGWDRILPVCNEHYGTIDKLPFDIPERRVIAYTLSENPTPEELAVAKEGLTAVFKGRLKEILKLNRESILDIQLGNPDTEELFGHDHDCTLVKCDISDCPNGRVRKYERSLSSGYGMEMRDPSVNSQYYAEVVTYTSYKNITKRFSFAVLNRSDATLLSPRLEVVIDAPMDHLIAFDVDTFPSKPSKTFRLSGTVPAMLAKQSRQNVAELKRTQDKSLFRADLVNIQAKRIAWTTPCYLGTGMDSLTLNCRLYADNLKHPFEQRLTLRFEIEEESKTLQGWIDAKFSATVLAKQIGAPESE